MKKASSKKKAKKKASSKKKAKKKASPKKKAKKKASSKKKVQKKAKKKAQKKAKKKAKKKAQKKAKKKAKKKATKKASPRRERTAPPLFEALKGVLAPLGRKLRVAREDATHYTLDTAVSGPLGQPLCFASLERQADGVRLHFYPVHAHPELLDELPGALRGCLRPPSCFVLTTASPALLRELSGLVRRGYERWHETGWA